MHTALPRGGVENRFEMLLAHALEHALEIGLVHPAHELGLVARQRVERTVRQPDSVALEIGLVALVNEHVDDRRGRGDRDGIWRRAAPRRPRRPPALA